MFGRLEFIQKAAVVVASLVLAMAALVLTLKIKIAPSYSDFVVGAITWSASSKVQDLLAAPAFIVALLLSFVFLTLSLTKQANTFGVQPARDFSEQLLWWSMPAFAGIFRLLSEPDVNTTVFLISAAGIAFVAIAVRYHLARGIDLGAKQLGISVLAIFLVAIVPIELAIVLGRAPMSVVGALALEKLTKLALAISVLALPLGLLIVVKFPSRWLRQLPILILLGQLALPSYYLTLYPARLLLPDGNLAKYETTFFLKIFVVGMIVWVWIDVIRRFQRRVSVDNLTELFSPIAIFSLLLGLRFGNTAAPYISPDDYHFGEWLLGWWSYLQGAVPYVGYVPAHGLIDDDLARVVSSIFYDGSAGSVGDARRVGVAILALSSFLAVRRITGSIGLAFVSTFLVTARPSWLFLTAFIFLWLSQSLIERPSKWLAVWIASAPIVILAVPPQGLLLVAASSIIALYCIWRLWTAPEQRHWRLIGASAGLVLCLGIFTPAGIMFLGAVKYILENAPINTVAYGLPWELSWNGRARSGLIFEIVRMSWVAVILGCIASIYLAAQGTKRRYESYFPPVVAGLFALLLIPYSMGRIDPGAVSRPGLIAILGWVALLPAASWWLLNSSQRVFLVFFVACMSATLNFVPLSILNLSSAASQTIPSLSLRDGAGAGLANIGKAGVEDAHWDRLLRLSRLINSKLDAADTYLDLTSRNAQYFYLNRKPPVAVTAPYNMAPLSQQKHAVEMLSRNMPKLALLEGSNITQDGGGLALRNPYLYRFIVENYEPSYEDGFILGYLTPRGKAESDLTYVNVSVRKLTDNNWQAGLHRAEAAIILENPILLQHIKVGDGIRLADDSQRIVTKIWPEGSAIWMDGPRLNTEQLSYSHQVQFAMNSERASKYRTELLQRAFSQTELQRIPVAWGRSSMSLSNKMDLLESLDGKANTHDLNAAGNGNFKVSGADPYLRFDISNQSLTGAQAGLLRFEFVCKGQTTEPRMQVFYWGGSDTDPSETSSIKFTASNGTLIVPLEASPRWLMLKSIKGVRIDLDTPSACTEIQINSVGLFKRRFE